MNAADLAFIFIFSVRRQKLRFFCFSCDFMLVIFWSQWKLELFNWSKEAVLLS